MATWRCGAAKTGCATTAWRRSEISRTRRWGANASISRCARPRDARCKARLAQCRARALRQAHRRARDCGLALSGLHARQRSGGDEVVDQPSHRLLLGLEVVGVRAQTQAGLRFGLRQEALRVRW